MDIPHHLQRINLITESADFPEFLKRKDAVGCVWSDIEQSAKVHEQQLDKEFASLQQIAALKPGSYDLAVKFAKTFNVDGRHPDPKVFRDHFSAAMNTRKQQSLALGQEQILARMIPADTATSSCSFIWRTPKLNS